MLTQTLFALFVLSGLCGLVYQIVWLRLAFRSFGIATPVLSDVVSPENREDPEEHIFSNPGPDGPRVVLYRAVE